MLFWRINGKIYETDVMWNSWFIKKTLKKISARPTFQSCIILNENLVGVKQIK